jgi:hypothetical protein
MVEATTAITSETVTTTTVASVFGSFLDLTPTDRRNGRRYPFLSASLIRTGRQSVRVCIALLGLWCGSQNALRPEGVKNQEHYREKLGGWNFREPEHITLGLSMYRHSRP